MPDSTPPEKEGERFVFFLKVSFETLIEMLKHHKDLKGDIG